MSCAIFALKVLFTDAYLFAFDRSLLLFVRLLYDWMTKNSVCTSAAHSIMIVALGKLREVDEAER